MSVLIHTGEHGPAIIALLVAGIGWAGIELEKRRRRRRAAAGLPIYDGMRAPGEEGGLVRQSLPLSREVVEHFRGLGPGWQARIDEVLKFHVREAEDRARRRAAGAAEPTEAAKARVAEERSDYDAGEGGRGKGG